MVVFGGKIEAWRNPKVQLSTALEGFGIEWILLYINSVPTIFSSSMESFNFCEFSLM